MAAIPWVSSCLVGAGIDGGPEYLYVWVADDDGYDDDYVAVVDINDSRSTYSTVLSTTAVGSKRNEPHHGMPDPFSVKFVGTGSDGGSTYRSFWPVSGMAGNRTWIFEISDPANPAIHAIIGPGGPPAGPKVKWPFGWDHDTTIAPSGRIITSQWSLQASTWGKVHGGPNRSTPGALMEYDYLGSIKRVFPAFDATKDYSCVSGGAADGGIDPAANPGPPGRSIESDLEPRALLGSRNDRHRHSRHPHRVAALLCRYCRGRRRLSMQLHPLQHSRLGPIVVSPALPQACNHRYLLVTYGKNNQVLYFDLGVDGRDVALPARQVATIATNQTPHMSRPTNDFNRVYVTHFFEALLDFQIDSSRDVRRIDLTYTADGGMNGVMRAAACFEVRFNRRYLLDGGVTADTLPTGGGRPNMMVSVGTAPPAGTPAFPPAILP